MPHHSTHQTEHVYSDVPQLSPHELESIYGWDLFTTKLIYSQPSRNLFNNMKAGLHRQPCCKRTLLKICEKLVLGSRQVFVFVIGLISGHSTKDGWCWMCVMCSMPQDHMRLFWKELLYQLGTIVCSLVTVKPRGSTTNGDCTYKRPQNPAI